MPTALLNRLWLSTRFPISSLSPKSPTSLHLPPPDLDLPHSRWQHRLGHPPRLRAPPPIRIDEREVVLHHQIRHDHLKLEVDQEAARTGMAAVAERQEARSGRHEGEPGRRVALGSGRAVGGAFAHAREAERIEFQGFGVDGVVALGGVGEHGDHGAFGEEHPVLGAQVVHHDGAEEAAVAEGVHAQRFAEDAVGADHFRDGAFGPRVRLRHGGGDFGAEHGDGVVLRVGGEDVEDDVCDGDAGLVVGAEVGHAQTQGNLVEVEFRWAIGLGVA